MTKAQTLYEKIWRSHVVVQRDDGYSLLYIDRHLMNDGAGAGLQAVQDRGLTIRRPDLSFATPDHFVRSDSRKVTDILDPDHQNLVQKMRTLTRQNRVTLFDLDDPRQGIAHVVGPELGITLPGCTLVCGDSHTSTHGALGALAFGIGASELEHVIATQCLWQKKSKTMRVWVTGELDTHVTAKDLIIALIEKIGTAGATGHVIEYAGPTIRSMSIEGRLTICNMSIEAGAKAGMIAPDESTLAYLKDRMFAPSGLSWDRLEARVQTLVSDPDASFDREVSLDAAEVAPMVTWGTNPGQASPITGRVPLPDQLDDDTERYAIQRSLDYMALKPGTPLNTIAIDRVFIGSCTNSRIEDLRAAAKVVAGHFARVPSWVVPGSGQVKAAAEREGLDRIFIEAGFEWRDAGCSMCIGMNGDSCKPGERVASTSNRNFMGRQGPRVRTHLMSPAMAAAAALTGRLTDVRRVAEVVR